MRKLLKISGAILICVALLFVTVRVTGFEPRDCDGAGVSWTCRVPGLWLKGNLVTTPVNDWSFIDQYTKDQSCRPETGLWLAHSITTYCVAIRMELYLTSLYARISVSPWQTLE